MSKLTLNLLTLILFCLPVCACANDKSQEVEFPVVAYLSYSDVIIERMGYPFKYDEAGREKFVKTEFKVPLYCRILIIKDKDLNIEFVPTHPLLPPFEEENELIQRTFKCAKDERGLVLTYISADEICNILPISPTSQAGIEAILQNIHNKFALVAYTMGVPPNYDWAPVYEHEKTVLGESYKSEPGTDIAIKNREPKPAYPAQELTNPLPGMVVLPKLPTNSKGMAPDCPGLEVPPEVYPSSWP